MKFYDKKPGTYVTNRTKSSADIEIVTGKNDLNKYQYSWNGFSISVKSDVKIDTAHLKRICIEEKAISDAQFKMSPPQSRNGWLQQLPIKR